MKAILAWLRPHYTVRAEEIGGATYYMVYMRVFGMSLFLARWNSESSADSAVLRLRPAPNRSDAMQRYEYLDHDGYRYVWVDGVLITYGMPEDRLKKLGSRKPYAVSMHIASQK